MTKHTNVGSSFDDFLAEDGILDDVQAEALTRLIAWEMRTAMEKRGLSEAALARRIKPPESE